jgi:hypothetical protein
MRLSNMRWVLILLCTGLAAGFALAQIGQTTGRIEGTVKDSSGALVPGVTVTLSSSTGTKTAITNENGRFSFPFLTPDEYDLKADLSGFKSIEQKAIPVRLGVTSSLSLVLTPGELSDVVTVTGEAPLVDTTTTTIGANIVESMYTSIPVRRNFTALLSMAPGVNDGGSVGAANPSISGGSGLENNYLVDGINITNTGFGGVGTYSNFLYGSLGSGVNFDFVKEVQVKAGGFEAEYGQSTGGVVNVITKSGGNEFHGGVYFYGQPAGFQAAKKQPNDDRYSKTTMNLAQENFDVGGDLSGYLWKDRFFFYFGFNPFWTTNFNRAPNGYGQDVNGLPLYKQHNHVYSWAAKVTWIPHADHNFEFSTFADPSNTSEGPNRDMSIGGTDCYSSLHYGSWNWIGRYNGILTPNWFLTASVGRAYSRFHESMTHPEAAHIWDFVGYYYNYVLPVNPLAPPTNYSYNITGGLGNIMNNEGKNWQFNVKSTYNFNAAGNHTLDLGYVYEDIDFTGEFGFTGPDVTIPPYPEAGFPGGISHGVWANHVWLTPNMLDPRNPDSNPIDLNGDGVIDMYDAVYWQIRGQFSDPLRHSNTKYHSFYFQDAWKINNRLVLKLGLRYDHQKMAGKEEAYVFDGNWAPRFGLVYDLFGDGKTKIYGSWGRFFEKIPNDLAVRAFAGEILLTKVLWGDPGFNYFLNPLLGIPTVGMAGGVVPVLDKTESMYQDEFVIGFDRELTPSLALGARFIRRDLRRVLETISNMTVEQVFIQPNDLRYYVGNPSDTVDYFHNDTGALGPDGIADGFGEASRVYNALEINLDKRFANGLQFLANYRLSKLWGTYEGLYRNDNQQDDPNLSSLFDFRNSPLLAYEYTPGYLNTDRRHINKFNGFYTFTMKLTLGMGIRVSSGLPLTPLGTQPVYVSDGEIPLKPRGDDGRGDWINSVDLHADYPFTFGDNFRLRLALDLFNVFNRQEIVMYDQDAQLSFVPNPDYLTAMSYQRPFNARFSIRLEF